MNDLLRLYAPTIAAGFFAAIALALGGCQLAARDKAMQTLCLGQGSMLGVLIGITMIDLSHQESELLGHAGPFLAAVVMALVVALCGELITGRKAASKNSYFTALFSCLLALNYLVSAVFPALESHMAQVFFGDLATLTGFDVTLTMVAGMIVAAMLAWGIGPHSNYSFELTTFGAEHQPGPSGRTRVASGIFFLFLCLCIQFLGFLFTVACLFLPTAVLSLRSVPGLRRHVVSVASLAGFASVAGFLLSLNNPRLPTVPTIVTVMATTGLIVNAVLALGAGFRRASSL